MSTHRTRAREPDLLDDPTSLRGGLIRWNELHETCLAALVRRGVEPRVLVALARGEWAGIAAAHRDHDLVRERLGERLRDVDPAPA